MEDNKKEGITFKDWTNLMATVFGLILIIIPIKTTYIIRGIAFIIMMLLLYSSGLITRFILMYKRLMSIKYDMISMFYADRFLALSIIFERIINDEIIQEIFKQAKKDYKNDIGKRYNEFINGYTFSEKWKGIKKWKGIRKFNHGSLLENIFKFQDYVIRGHATYINDIIDKDNISEDIKNRYNNYFRISYLHFIDLYMILLFEIEYKFKNSYYFQSYYNSITTKDLQIRNLK